jgi:hypothetical protein
LRPVARGKLSTKRWAIAAVEGDCNINRENMVAHIVKLPRSKTVNKYGSQQEHSMTLNINLTPQLEDMVRQKVAGGLYNSAM